MTADGREYAADTVVLCNGVGIPPLAAHAGVQVPLLHKPAVVAYTEPLPGPRLVRHMLCSHDAFVLQASQAHHRGPRVPTDTVPPRAPLHALCLTRICGAQPQHTARLLFVSLYAL